MTGFCRNICGPSHKESLAPKLSSSFTISSNVTAAGAHQYCSGQHLCQWYRPIEEEHEMATVPPAPVNSKRHLIARANESAKVQPSDSAPPTAVIPLIMSTELSLPSASLPR